MMQVHQKHTEVYRYIATETYNKISVSPCLVVLIVVKRYNIMNAKLRISINIIKNSQIAEKEARF